MFNLAAKEPFGCPEETALKPLAPNIFPSISKILNYEEDLN
jgi:hypothetical protein